MAPNQPIDEPTATRDNRSFDFPRIAVPLSPSSLHHCLVVMPARDEAASIGDVVREARATLGADVLVVNDDSSDATSAEARAAGAQVLNLSQQLGAWGATQTGLRFALRRGYQHVVTMDADGQHHAASLPVLMKELEARGVDVMIGSYESRLSPAKRLAWGYFRLITGISVRDFTSGLRAYGPRAVQILARPDASLLDYQDIGVLMLLKLHGLSLAEIETPMSPRRNGISRVFSSWPTVARYMLASTVLCLARFDRTHGARPERSDET